VSVGSDRPLVVTMLIPVKNEGLNLTIVLEIQHLRWLPGGCVSRVVRGGLHRGR
jgi:hypothetical protein